MRKTKKHQAKKNSARHIETEVDLVRHGKGVEIPAIFEHADLPLMVGAYAVGHHEVTLVRLGLDFFVLEAKPRHLIGDKVYGDDVLDKELRMQGVEIVAPRRSSRNLKTQNGRKLRRHARRWIAERFFG